MKKLNTLWLVVLAFATGVFAHDDSQPREPLFPRDVHGLWWQPIDPGWATMVFDHKTAMSSVLLVYDFDGVPTWYIAPRHDCFREGSPALNANCLGPLYRVTGPWFGESAFRPDQVSVQTVGQWDGWWSTPQFASVGPNEGRRLYVTYSVNGRTVMPIADQPMTAQVIDPDAPFLYYDTFQSGLWGVPSETGWGIGMFRQGNRISGALLLHGRDRQPRWYVVNLRAPDFNFDPDRLYEGEVYETRGSPFGERFTRDVTVRQVGSASLRFGTALEDPAALRYSIDGVQVSKSIYRVP